jgi:hypothetical protein
MIKLRRNATFILSFIHFFLFFFLIRIYLQEYQVSNQIQLNQEKFLNSFSNIYYSKKKKSEFLLLSN